MRWFMALEYTVLMDRVQPAIQLQTTALYSCVSASSFSVFDVDLKPNLEAKPDGGAWHPDTNYITLAEYKVCTCNF